LNDQDTSTPAALKLVESVSALSCAVSLEVDARKLACPLPLLKAKQGLRALVIGDLIRVLSTDAGSLKDFVSFSHLTGQVLEGFYQQDDYYCFLIRKQ
jgi:tRNA 2-thiouridine synthesizing protein A